MVAHFGYLTIKEEKGLIFPVDPFFFSSYLLTFRYCFWWFGYSYLYKRKFWLICWKDEVICLSNLIGLTIFRVQLHCEIRGFTYEFAFDLMFQVIFMFCTWLFPWMFYIPFLLLKLITAIFSEPLEILGVGGLSEALFYGLNAVSASYKISGRAVLWGL